MERLSGKKKISRVSIAEQVCASIKMDIVSGVWKEGDKLPAEGEFAEMFGVNRLSVRLALQKLNTLGIIETRVGDGSYVKPFSLEHLFSEVAIFYKGEDQFANIRQLRYLLESDCIRLAAQLATKDEIERLGSALQHYNEMMVEFLKDIDDEERLKQVTNADFLFHSQLIKMSHNSLYVDIYYMVRILIQDHMKQLLNRRAHTRRDMGMQTPFPNGVHERVYRAIVEKNDETVQQLCKEMLAITPISGLDVFD